MKKYDIFENDFLDVMRLYKNIDQKFLYWLPLVKKYYSTSYSLDLNLIQNNKVELIHSKI
jgi:hypothetical protein